jgi:DNA-directed RNA polymerase specialized sigma24 family protein
MARDRPPDSPLKEFEQIYLRNVEVLMGYFARRCRDPQTVADLTSETFVRAVDGFAKFDPHRGSDRAWLFGIAAHVFARHCAQSAGGREATSPPSHARLVALYPPRPTSFRERLPGSVSPDVVVVPGGSGCWPRPARRGCG